MIITHNMSAMNANNRIKTVSKSLSKNASKLSSGYRINVAADDAAGLTISEKMRAQIRGLDKAAKNAQDGISYIQVAEGALDETHSLLQRCRELAVQAANDTNTTADRTAIQAELDQLSVELDRVSKTTQFNTMNIFTNDGSTPNKSVGDISVNVTWSFVDAAGNVVNVDDSQAVGKDTNYKDSDYAKFIEKAAADAVAELYSKYQGSLFNNSSSTINIGLNIANIDGAGGTLASAALSMSSSGTYTTMAYTLNIDKSDYDATNFSTMTDAQKADLAATVSHEMTHLVMYDTLIDGMISGTTESFPKWFVEGMAQSSSGDGGWVSNQLSATSSDAVIQNYMSQMKTMPYGAGYLATMYLGYAASGSTQTNNLQSDIVAGLNNIFTSLTSGKTLDEAIAENTNYGGLSDFENSFQNADSQALNFVKSLLNERGSGAGSLLANSLSDSQEDVFAESNLTDDIGNYVIKSDNTRYMNAYGTGYVFPEKEKGTAGLADALNLQVGALAGQSIQLERYDVSADVLFENNTLDVSNFENAGNAITTVDQAIEKVSNIRSYYGAVQNRLESTIKNLENTSENTQAAESKIRDTDMAKEMVEYSKNNILLQVGQTILAQANQETSSVLQLLQ